MAHEMLQRWCTKSTTVQLLSVPSFSHFSKSRENRFLLLHWSGFITEWELSATLFSLLLLLDIYYLWGWPPMTLCTRGGQRFSLTTWVPGIELSSSRVVVGAFYPLRHFINPYFCSEFWSSNHPDLYWIPMVRVLGGRIMPPSRMKKP